MYDVPEILSLVFGNLRIRHSNVGEIVPFTTENLFFDFEKKRTLYNAALASRTMSQAALPVLWSSIDCFSQLARTIRGLELWSENATKEWILARPLEPEDLDRFDFYAKFVKTMRVKSEGGQIGPGIARSVLFQLIALRNGPLLPHLERLLISPFCEYPLIFVSPTLRTLHIEDPPRRFLDDTDPSASPVVWALIRSLPSRVPDLEELRVDAALSLTSFQDILGLKRLRRLSFSKAVYHEFSDVARQLWKTSFLKGLADLTRFEFLDLGPLEVAGRPGIDVLRTRTLALSLEAFQYNQILASLALHTLEGFALNGIADVRNWTSVAQQQQLFKTLADRQYATLTQLKITNWRKLDASWLTPLLEIRGIKVFDMSFASCSSLSDGVLQDISSAWSQLEVFRLYSGSENPDVTVKAIMSFAKNCPRLHHLALDIHAIVVPKPSRGLQLQHVTMFSVSGWSRVGKAVAVPLVNFLDVMFPSLLYTFVERRGKLESEGYDRNGNTLSTWQEVVDTVNGRRLEEMTKWRLDKAYQPRQRW